MDATNAGVARGGLISKDEIRILICYILNSLNEPVPGVQLSELLHFEGIANYFEVGSAFSELCGNNLIEQLPGEPASYVITPQGRNVAVTLCTSVPITIRDKAYALTVKMLARIKYVKETKIDITPLPVGYNIRCAIMEGSLELMSVSLFVTDEAQALNIKERFLNDPTAIYSGTIELLTNQKLY